MSSSASLKCLSRRELQAGNKLTLSFYKVVKEAKVGLPETSFEEILKLRSSNLVEYEELKSVCKDSDAALISGEGLALFINFKKMSPSIQLLKIPAVVKEISIARITSGNNVASDDSESEFTGLKLRTEKIELSEELIAFDSVVKGDLDDGMYALRIVSDKLDSIITEDEIRKHLTKQGERLKTSRKPSRKRRGKKSKKARKRKKKRRKSSRKSR